MPYLKKNTEKEIVYAGFWIRLLATLIDSIILFIVTMSCILIFWYFNQDTLAKISKDKESIKELINLIDIVSLIPFFIYYTLTTGSSMQASIGKKALGLKVVRSDNSEITYLRSFVRTFAYIISALPIYIGYIMAGFTKQKTSLHDLIVDTRVIYTKRHL